MSQFPSLMKSHFLSLSLACALATPVLAEIPAEAEALIDETAATAAVELMTAIELANAEAQNEKNFAILAKSLSQFGFGETPPTPPFFNTRGGQKEESEADARAREDREKEIAERIKMLGQADLEFLKSLDVNQDLKVDTEELHQSVKDQLIFDLKDKLNVDGDGDNRLSLKEYALAVPAKGEKDEDGIDWHQRGHFEHDDANGDGYLDVTEMMGHEAGAMVKRATLIHFVHLLPGVDADGDGAISEAEFAALSEKAGEVWKKASPEGAPIALERVYPDLFWLRPDDFKVLMP